MQPKFNYNTPILKNMGANMKTTLDLSDALFFMAKEVAAKQKTTLRALVEEGLRKVLGERQQATQTSFKLRNASVRGGATIHLDGHALRDLANERPSTQSQSW
jgi:hypothetical protein